MTDLVRDLNRGEDVTLLRLTTDNPRPEYLRISVLNRFSNNEWSSGDREIPQAQRAFGDMPPPSGVTATVRRRDYAYQMSASTNFDSTWLPTAPLVTTIQAPGDWRYDLSTMDFLAADDITTAGLDYSMTSSELELTAAQLAASPAAVGSVSDQFTELPADLPGVVGQLAIQVTAARIVE